MTLRAVAVLAALLLGTAPEVAGVGGPPGTVRFVKGAESDFDRYSRDPTAAQKEWMRAHYWRLRGYAPYFDSRLAWAPPTWVYKDLYAIYRGSSMAESHPEWILKDENGNRLFIPYDCAGGTCPQFAGDIGNPDFRARWIAAARATLDKGYVGLFVDDVNMDLSRVSDGGGRPVVPRDPRTGGPMTNADWRRYMARFTEEIRDAFPGREIVHNALWFFGHDDPLIQRQLRSADYIELERGVNDPGLVGGGGEFGFDTLLAHLDWLHAEGKGVIFDANAQSRQGREYGLAAYFLLDEGRDGLGNDPGGTPDDWWCGYDVSLGAPLGPRYAWKGVFRRDFERGLVLVNPPDAAERTLTLDQAVLDLSCQRPTSVTLGPAAGVVLQTGL